MLFKTFSLIPNNEITYLYQLKPQKFLYLKCNNFRKIKIINHIQNKEEMNQMEINFKAVLVKVLAKEFLKRKREKGPVGEINNKQVQWVI